MYTEISRRHISRTIRDIFPVINADKYIRASFFDGVIYFNNKSVYCHYKRDYR